MEIESNDDGGIENMKYEVKNSCSKKKQRLKKNIMKQIKCQIINELWITTEMKFEDNG